MQKNRLFLIFLLFAISLHAQEPVQQAFEFHKPIAGLQYLAAACAVKSISGDVRTVVLADTLEKNTGDRLTDYETLFLERYQRLSKNLQSFLSFMCAHMTDDEKLGHAIRTNDIELLKLALPGTKDSKNGAPNDSSNVAKEAISCQRFARIVAPVINEYHAPDTHTPAITALEYVLAHARHIPQNFFNYWPHRSSNYVTANLLMYGGIIIDDSRQYAIEGGLRGQFLNRLEDCPLHRAIVTGSLDVQEHGKREANAWDYPDCCRGVMTVADSAQLGLIETNKAVLDTRKRDEWWRAAEHDRYVAARAVLQSGVDVNQRSFEEITPLHLASIYGGKRFAGHAC